MDRNFVGLALLGLAACAGPRRPGTAPERPPVPPVTPNHYPREVYTDTNVTSRSPEITGPILKNIVLVAFQPGTPQPKRQEAVDAIGGEVLGGLRELGDDGYYFVRVPSDSLARGVFAAIRQLKRLPQVLDAYPESLSCRSRP